LREIIDLLIICGHQNIVIRRGHTEDKSYSMAILRHVSKYDEILQSHLYNTEPNSRIKYTSPDIKIIKISGEMVGELVMTEYFGLIGDFNWSLVFQHMNKSPCVYGLLNVLAVKSYFVRNILVL
jgi:hypothetical protein